MQVVRTASAAGVEHIAVVSDYSSRYFLGQISLERLRHVLQVADLGRGVSALGRESASAEDVVDSSYMTVHSVASEYVSGIDSGEVSFSSRRPRSIPTTLPPLLPFESAFAVHETMALHDVRCLSAVPLSRYYISLFVFVFFVLFTFLSFLSFFLSSSALLVGFTVRLPSYRRSRVIACGSPLISIWTGTAYLHRTTRRACIRAAARSFGWYSVSRSVDRGCAPARGAAQHSRPLSPGIRCSSFYCDCRQRNAADAKCHAGCWWTCHCVDDRA